MDICAERELFLSNTFFQHKIIHRYTWARGDARSLIDYLAVDYRLKREEEDAKVVRELFSDSDHFAVVAKGVLSPTPSSGVQDDQEAGQPAGLKESSLHAVRKPKVTKEERDEESQAAGLRQEVLDD